VRYFDRQFLRPEYFETEQAYHVAMHRRHNISLHTWGIVSGLVVQEDENSLFVQPGFAIDGYGREIILTQRRQLAVEEFDRQRSEVLDVWTRYSRQYTDQAPRGYAGCGSTSEAYRSPESPVIRFEKPDPSYRNRRQPKGVPTTDHGFSATRMPPDDPTLIWPVFLGQVTRGGPADKRTYTVNPADRPYAGLIGESIVAPSGETRVQIGRSASANDPPGFAVFIPAVAHRVDGASLQIDHENHITLRGDTTVSGDVIISDGALEFSVTAPPAPAAAGAMAAAPAAPVAGNQAQPWKIYVADNEDGGTDLRIEMAEHVNASNRVAIGAFSEDDKKFISCLTVADDCTVTVANNLVVAGRIEGPNGVPPDWVMNGVAREVQDIVLANLLGGVGGSAAVLQRFFKAPVPTPGLTITPASIAAFLDASTAEANELMREIKDNYPQLKARLLSGLV
jgi:hypothetical protein